MQCSFNRFCFFTASACHTTVIYAVALPCADAYAQSAAFLAERGGERVALAADEGDGLRDVVVGAVDGDGYEVVARGEPMFAWLSLIVYVLETGVTAYW